MTTILRKVRKRTESLLSKIAQELQAPLAACTRIAISPGDVRAVSVASAEADDSYDAPR
jgi:hypothetical protein